LKGLPILSCKFKFEFLLSLFAECTQRHCFQLPEHNAVLFKKPFPLSFEAGIFACQREKREKGGRKLGWDVEVNK
jgi:hypothetical protein